MHIRTCHVFLPRVLVVSWRQVQIKHINSKIYMIQFTLRLKWGYRKGNRVPKGNQFRMYPKCKDGDIFMLLKGKLAELMTLVKPKLYRQYV